jgi:hypothetical protein
LISVIGAENAGSKPVACSKEDFKNKTRPESRKADRLSADLQSRGN